VGEYENLLNLEAVRLLKLSKPNDVLLVLVSFIPALGAGGTELKTKPTQHAVRSLNSVGIHPDIILGRANVPLDQKRKEKIQFMCSIEEGNVISAPNVDDIYEIPLNFEKDKMSDRILKKLSLKPRKTNMKDWRAMVESAQKSSKTVKIGIVGKYFGSGDFVLTDSYISVLEAIKHGAYYWKCKPEIEWIDSEDFEKDSAHLNTLKKYGGIIVPGGFGSRGIEGKIKAIEFCRKNKIPYLGLCYGMQLMVVEFARNVCGLKDAHTTEIDRETKNPVVDIMPEQKKNLEDKNYGATMRLGAYPAAIEMRTQAFAAYKKHLISERHRHRWEVNPEYIEVLKKNGLVFSGKSPDGKLMEIAELPKEIHPFFVGSQFHPEFKSRPLAPHPLFREFIKAAMR
jgi:CTP synthase